MVKHWNGSKCLEFEEEVVSWVGVMHSVALSNGTLALDVALDVALKALGVGSGDKVVLTPLR